MSLYDLISAYEAQPGCMAACVILDADTGETLVSHRPDTVFKSASLIKTPMMLNALEQVEKGKLTLDTLIPVPPCHYTLDEGALLKEGSELPLHRLLYYMITHSNNTATNVLIDYFGMDDVNALSKRIGMPDTLLRRRMLDYEAGRQGRENLTCARDMARMYHLIYQHKELSPFVCDTSIPILLQQHDKELIMASMPEQKAAHKTGGLSDISHDAGILYGEHRTLIFAVLATAPEENTCLRFQSDMSPFVKAML